MSLFNKYDCIKINIEIVINKINKFEKTFRV